MDEIVRRLRNRDKRSLNYLKDSMLVEGKLLEKDEDEEEELPPIEDEEIGTEVPEETEDTEPSYDDSEVDDTTSDEEKESDTPEEDASKESEDEEELYVNPLDNPYAVHYTIGHKVALTYADGSKTAITGEVEGYDLEGFYRIRWSNGRTMNGITDIALSEMIEHTEESKCVCGSTEFVTEGDHTICDNCGRRIRENNDPLSKADKSRPKGKRLIRSEAHPISTSIEESAEETPTRTVGIYGDEVTGMDSVDQIVAYLESKGLKVSDVSGDMESGWDMTVTGNPRDLFFAITNTFKGYRCDSVGEFIDRYAIDESVGEEKPETDTSKIDAIKESIRRALNARRQSLKESIIDTEEFSRLRDLEGMFWTRLSEIEMDILRIGGYEVVDSNSEYITVVSDEDEDTEVLIPIGGTSRTMTLELDKARKLK